MQLYRRVCLFVHGKPLDDERPIVYTYPPPPSVPSQFVPFSLFSFVCVAVAIRAHIYNGGGPCKVKK